MRQHYISAVEGIVLTLHNIGGIINLERRLDLKTIALHARHAKYNPKSEDDSRLASRKYARIVQKLGFDAKFSEFKIQNIVGSCDVNSHGQLSSYEPELFPGLIYHMIKPKVVLLIFVVLTGAKDHDGPTPSVYLASVATSADASCTP
ncbi:hypothetical protein BDZ89DRAFT_1197071 [Hymenopellis radicata]|nr:hypothetical protein BDZ89DRAFT_1197071 [Hymenopellis radicata]